MKKKIFWPLFIGTSVIAASYTYESIQEKNDLRKIKSYGKRVTTRFGTMNLSISGMEKAIIRFVQEAFKTSVKRFML